MAAYCGRQYKKKTKKFYKLWGFSKFFGAQLKKMKFLITAGGVPNFLGGHGHPHPPPNSASANEAPIQLELLQQWDNIFNPSRIPYSIVNNSLVVYFSKAMCMNGVSFSTVPVS